MAVSQNGYPANDRSVLAPFFVGDRKFMFRRGPTGSLLHHGISWFDANIRDINPGIVDDWSYAERLIRGGFSVSNHASGTAGDVDATRWPLGRSPESYLTPDEIRRWRNHLTIYEGCLRWGGDYTGRKDPMHVEIDKDEQTCARVWAKIAGTPIVHPPAPAPAPAPSGRPVLRIGSKGAHVGVWQRYLRDVYPAYRHESSVRRGVLLKVDNDFGAWTEAWTKLFQAKSGLKPDGVVGRLTYGKAGFQ